MRILSHKIVDLTPERMSRRTFRERVELPRTKGVQHVQAINRYLAIAAGKLKEDPDSFPAFGPNLYPLLPALGVAWEDLWQSLFPEDQLIWQPGEFERDGIYGTPDGLMIGSGALAECKLNYKKHKPITEDWLYMRQGLAYCSLSYNTLVEFHVCWCLSNYNRPYTPLYDVTLVEFSKNEIDSWWQRMLAVKDKVGAE